MKTGLKQERERRGWTQQHVADNVGISRIAVLQLETGVTKPSYDVLVKLEDLFGMTHRELFREAPQDTDGLSDRPTR